MDHKSSSLTTRGHPLLPQRRPIFSLRFCAAARQMVDPMSLAVRHVEVVKGTSSLVLHAEKAESRSPARSPFTSERTLSSWFPPAKCRHVDKLATASLHRARRFTALVSDMRAAPIVRDRDPFDGRPSAPCGDFGRGWTRFGDSGKG
jgi:hypothetical protein